MRGTTWAFAAVSLGFVAFSCGGQEFGGADDPDQSEAGESSTGEGGGGGSGGNVGTGGSKVTPPEGGSDGTVSTSGTGNDSAGMPTVIGSGGSPDQSCDQVPPELPGDCQKVVCSMGTLSSEPDGNDKPEPRGVCDVPQCKDGQPVFDSDPSQCQINESCHDGQCACAECPNGTVAALSNTLCRLPAGVTVTANKTYAESVAARVADGNAQTTWNSGDDDGVLTITFATPQPMTAIAMWLSGSADNNVTPDKKYISVHASVEVEADPVLLMKSGNFSFAQMSTGPLHLDLGLVMAKKITLTFESPSTYIAVHEVIFQLCQ
jgi:hypothetical protein